MSSLPSALVKHPQCSTASTICPFSFLLWMANLVLAINVTLSSAQEAPHPDLQLRNFEYPDPSRPLFTPSTKPGTFRTNFCNASFRVLVAQELPLERALEGFQITVSLDDADLFGNFDEDEEGNPIRLNADYPGILPLLLDEICERAGCTWRNSYSFFSNDLLPNETYSDLLFWSTSLYDLSGSYWARSIQRLRNGTTFVEPWYDGSIIMVAPFTSTQSDSFDPWGWLDPFEHSVWIMILVTLVFSMVVRWLLEVVFTTVDIPEHANGLASPSGLSLAWSDCCYLLRPWETLWQLGTAFTGHFEFQPTTGPAYLFSFSVAFWALLMGSAYTANLASFLVIRNQRSSPIMTLDEAVQQNMPMCIWRGTQTDIAVSAAFPAYAQSGRLIRLNDNLEVFQGLQDGTCDIAITVLTTWNVFQRDKRVNGKCNLEWIGRPFQTNPSSFAVRGDSGTLCTSLLRDVFNVHMLNIEAEGVLQEFWNQHLNRDATVDCSRSGGRSVTTSSSDDVEQDDNESGISNRKERHRELIRQNCHSNKAGHRDELRDASGRLLVTTDSTTAGEDSGSVSAGGDGGDSTKLSLTNMGGVFLLHGILSSLAVLFAVASWAWKRVNSRTKDKFETTDNIPDGKEHEEEPQYDLKPSHLAETAVRNHHTHQHEKHQHVVGGTRNSFQHSFLTPGSIGCDAESNLYAFRAEVSEKFKTLEKRFNAVDDRLLRLAQLETLEERLTSQLLSIEEKLISSPLVTDGST